MKVPLRAIAMFFALTTVCLVPAQTDTVSTAKRLPKVVGEATEVSAPLRVTESQWLFGGGWVNVLDTYISDLEYTGGDLAILHRTESLAHWGNDHVTTVGLYTLHGAYVHSPTDDGKEWDCELTASGGWLYNWKPASKWRFAAGGLAELSVGGTYNTRGSNNPAQGRASVQILGSGLAEYKFLVNDKEALARVQIDVPLTGVHFSPEYGQSYYEIFSLGHTSGIIHWTYPGNVPSAKMQASVQLPLLGSRLTLGYLADIRQSKLGGLKRHAWRHTLMVGFTRRLHIVRDK